MNKILFLIIFLAFLADVSGQKNKLIKTGRPESFEYNNAEKVVGKRWGINFGYFAFNGSDFDALDSITALNKVTEDKLAAKKGADWNRQFKMEVGMEMEKQNHFRQQINAETIGLNPDQEKFIHFEEGFFKNHYKAYVFSQVEKGEQKPFYTLIVYKVNMNKGSILLKSSRRKPIDFEYPENGIVRG